MEGARRMSARDRLERYDREAGGRAAVPGAHLAVLRRLSRRQRLRLLAGKPIDRPQRGPAQVPHPAARVIARALAWLVVVGAAVAAVQPAAARLAFKNGETAVVVRRSIGASRTVHYIVDGNAGDHFIVC